MANNASNLKRYPKGVSGNPGGRPSRLQLTDALRKELARKKGTIPNADAIAKVLVRAGIGGDLKAIELIADRVEGKPTQRMEQTGADGGPIQVDLPETREALERRIAELLGQRSA